ncbi:transcriptional regulator [Nocardiopsis kunsanensis]|uniref:Transcriptional regulator n=1 Tax=Nocardiopsis kunsanensis TaxID=141693 RepID=A0A918XF11_9ACTN|nr:LysR substrate-binding domain-containing protein [Nocardiopsis kunsanensis]GHD28789.1 transcriptional regulator [Nocardiopsis kunsanensis]
MRMTLPPLPGLQAFEATARLGSITAAAEELHLSPSAVSRRLRTTETHLGVTLFERRARSVNLTAMGRAYLPTVRAAFDDMAVGTAGLFGPPSRRRLTVRVQISYAATWLMPRLQNFHDAHPHIDLRVLNAIWADAVPPNEVDLEIRHGSGNWEGFTADLLHEDHAVIVASPDHLQEYGPITGPTGLHQRPRVHVLGYDDLWQRVLPRPVPVEEAGAGAAAATITLDTSIAATQFAAAGRHCALVPERFARTAVRSGQLVLLHDQRVPMHQAHYLLQREGTPQLSPEARAFVQWLIRQDIEDPPLQLAASQ